MEKSNIYNDMHASVFVQWIKFHYGYFFFHCLQIIDGGGFNFVVDENITQKYIATIRSPCKNGILLLS